MLAIPHRNQGQRFLLSPDGREAEWVDLANVPARCADWSDETALSIDELDALAAFRMAMNPRVEA